MRLQQGSARDVAVGGDDSVWIIGTDQRAGGFGVYQARCATTGPTPTSAPVRIAVDKSGNAWVVNDAGEIYMYNVASKAWEKKPASRQGATARSVHTGASSGTVWMLGTESIPGGFPIFQWDAATGTGNPMAHTEPWKSPRRRAYRGSFSQTAICIPKPPPITPSAPVDITRTWPPPTPQPQPPIRRYRVGQAALLRHRHLSDCRTPRPTMWESTLLTRPVM